MSQHEDERSTNINTGGGAVIGGSVTTGGQRVGLEDMVITGAGNVVADERSNVGSENREQPLQRLLDLLVDNFDLSELEALSFSLNADWDNLAGASKNEKARSLVAYASRRGIVSNLVALCARMRPQLDWGSSFGPQLDDAQRQKQESNGHLRVFLDYVLKDRPAAMSLYKRLVDDRFDVVPDTEMATTGSGWATNLERALRLSDVVIVLLSENSVDPQGHVQGAVRDTLEEIMEGPEGGVFVIPVRLDPNIQPINLARYQQIDYFKDTGYDRLVRSLRATAASLGLSPSIKPVHVG